MFHWTHSSYSAPKNVIWDLNIQTEKFEEAPLVFHPHALLSRLFTFLIVNDSESTYYTPEAWKVSHISTPAMRLIVCLENTFKTNCS